MATKGWSSRRFFAGVRKAIDKPSHEMERQGAVVIAMAAARGDSISDAAVAREVWMAMAAQRAKEMETPQ